ncbi:Succinate dehydrogenase, cytochrome b556 subunit [gamma proteobacterium HdN1]|nr:Succinate dehydrogenase, cytochrome b556 subunit [gamma proteobacterium HdN1]
MMTVNNQRPVHLDLRTIKLPITAYTSILHRISGVILFGGLILMLWALDVSLASEQGFEQVKGVLDNFFVKLITWGLLSALLYHLAAGVRHMLMDIDIGETLQGGRKGSKIVFIVSGVLILIAGIWVW